MDPQDPPLAPQCRAPVTACRPGPARGAARPAIKSTRLPQLLAIAFAILVPLAPAAMTEAIRHHLVHALLPAEGYGWGV